MQAGTFGEHMFTDVRQDTPECQPLVVVNSRHLIVHLGPSAQGRLHLGLKRFVNRPSYDFPPFE